MKISNRTFKNISIVCVVLASGILISRVVDLVLVQNFDKRDALFVFGAIVLWLNSFFSYQEYSKRVRSGIKFGR